MYGRSSIGYISDRSKKWNVPWHLVANKHQTAALDYLREDGRMAVVSSLADNFPNTVLECVGAGVPLLASNVGGIPEIISEADRETICFEPRPDVLAERIRTRWSTGPLPRALPSPSGTSKRTGCIGMTVWSLAFRLLQSRASDAQQQRRTFPW